MATDFQQRIIDVVRRIPRGKVATYGQVAALAGSPRAARQVVWTLHSRSEKANLPWQRVINGKGRIALKPGCGYEVQKALLCDEGIIFKADDSIDLDRYLWSPK